MAAHLREAQSFGVSSHNPSNGMKGVHVVQGAPGLPGAPVDGDAPCTAAAAWEKLPRRPAACRQIISLDGAAGQNIKFVSILMHSFLATRLLHTLTQP